MATKSPLTLMKEQFGEKAKLVEAVKGFVTDDLWLARTSADRGRDKGLEHVSNAKLLRLHATFSEVKAKFGTRSGLIDAIVDAEKRTKDEGFRKRLESYPVPRLHDLFRSATKRAKAAARSAEVKASGKPAAAKTAGAKPAAAKPAAVKPVATKGAKGGKSAKK